MGGTLPDPRSLELSQLLPACLDERVHLIDLGANASGPRSPKVDDIKTFTLNIIRMKRLLLLRPSNGERGVGRGGAGGEEGERRAPGYSKNMFVGAL